MRRVGGSAALALALTVGCEQPRTELVVVVASEVPWGTSGRIQAVMLTVRRNGPEGRVSSQRTTVLGMSEERQPLPLYVGVTPGEDTSTPVWIEAIGCSDPNRCPETPVVAQRAVVRFTPGRTLELTLLLASACEGASCSSAQRCVTGSGGVARCEEATLATLRPFGGSVVPAREDAAVVADVGADVGSVVDSTIDGGSATDVARVDRPPTDTSPIDAGPPDAGPVDTGRVDTGRVSTCPTGMRLIPEGQLLMGGMSDDPPALPVHGVRLTEFCMDETEVTVSAYQACGARCTTPGVGGTACNWTLSARNQHPINCVDWNQARTYCQWRGGDLPTEAQWEYAARGTDGRTYPWGNAVPGSQLCWSGGGTRLPTTCAVRSFSPSGDSPFGLSDMAGNVAEWTLDDRVPYTGDGASYVPNPRGPSTGSDPVVRGGARNDTLARGVRASFRGMSAITPATFDFTVGFRCVHGAM